MYVLTKNSATEMGCMGVRVYGCLGVRVCGWYYGDRRLKGKTPPHGTILTK